MIRNKKSKVSDILSIDKAFSLEDIDKTILKTLAVHGILNVNQITTRSTEISRKKIERRIKDFLLPNGFLEIYNELSYNNITYAFKGEREYIKRVNDKTRGFNDPIEYQTITIKNKGIKLTEKIYKLTLKGWLASINLVKLKDNFYLNYHLSLVEKDEHYAIKEYVNWFILLIAINLNSYKISANNIDPFDEYVKASRDQTIINPSTRKFYEETKHTLYGWANEVSENMNPRNSESVLEYEKILDLQFDNLDSYKIPKIKRKYRKRG